MGANANGPAPHSPAPLFARMSPASIRRPIGVCVTDGELPEVGTAVHIGNGLVTVPRRRWGPVRWWDPRQRFDAAALIRHGHGLLDVVHAEPASAFGLPLPDALAVAGALAAGDAEAAVGAA